MITKERMMEIAKKVTELTGDNEEIMSLLAEVTSDFDAPQVTPKEDIEDTEGISWKVKYQNMREKYIDRFFGGEPAKEESLPKEPEDIPSEEVSFDELFTEGKE